MTVWGRFLNSPSARRLLIMYKIIEKEFTLRVEDSRNYYSPYHDRERVIGELCIDLVDSYGYSASAIQIGESVAVQLPEGSTFLPVDILVTNPRGESLLIIETAAEDLYERGYNTAIRKLFTLGKTLYRNQNSPLFLVYHTHRHENGRFVSRHTIIDFRAYPDMKSWQSAGSPGRRDIPKNDNQIYKSDQ